MICNLLGLSSDNIFCENLKRKLTERVNSEARAQAIEDLGLLEEDLVVKLNSPLDTLTHYLSRRLRYGPNERDLVVLRHDIGILWPGHKREERGVNLVIYGDSKGHSAMARTVGFPTAIAVKMILDGMLLFLILAISRSIIIMKMGINSSKDKSCYQFADDKTF